MKRSSNSIYYFSNVFLTSYPITKSKDTLRRLEEVKTIVESLESEENSKYFIDTFAYILREMKEYELTATMREVSLDLVIGYEVKNTLEK